jgi:hypothetical protein
MCSNTRTSAQTAKKNSASTAEDSDSAGNNVRTLPDSWAGYLALKRGDEHFNLPSELLKMPPVLAMLTDSLSVPMTIVYALQKHYGNAELGTMTDVCVHVIGAKATYENFGSHKYEEILHWLPACRSLSLFLVGPEAGSESEEIEVCEACVGAGCIPIQVICIQDIYHQWDGRNKKPTLVLACNSGIHQDAILTAEEADGDPEDPEAQAESESLWEPTVQFLIATGTPCAFTACNEFEMAQDEECLREYGFAVLGQGHARNPWRGLTPHKELYKDEEFFYMNQYVVFCKGGQTTPST